MKKLFFVITIALISFCAKAQYNDIKVGPMGAGMILTYQRTINENFSATVGFDIGRYGEYEILSGGDEKEVLFQRIAYGLIGDFRVYPFKKYVAPKGFFTGIHIKDFIVEEQTPDITVTNNVLNVGLNFGYQWVWGNFTMEALTGYGFSKALSIDSDRNLLGPEHQYNLSNLGVFRIQFCIGVVFPKFKKLD